MPMGINMKRAKEQASQKTAGSSGCLVFFLLIITVISILAFSGGGIKKDLSYLIKGDADVFGFIEDIKKSYSENMTYPDFSPPILGNIISHFGERINPITNLKETHTGIDIDINAGTDVLSAAKGRVKKIGIDERFGNYIIIEHNSVFSTCYSHLSEITKNENDTVSKGDKIGIVGDTGLTTGKYLHFEIRKGEDRINPQTYIKW